MKRENALVVIDPQNDFCDRRGSLFVDGADADMERLSQYIKEKADDIAAIFISLDSHDSVAIFHPTFWIDASGNHPAPFTAIAPEDFRSGKWSAAEAHAPFAALTFAAMEAKKTGPLMVWPEHCVVSTWGHEIAAPLREALRAWRERTGLPVRYVFKGENPYTDQFSAFEGLDDTYPETAFNENFFARLAAFDGVTFAGEALSHCVRESILSYVRRLAKTKNPQQPVTLLTDCTSPVAGFDRKAALKTLEDAGIIFAQAARA